MKIYLDNAATTKVDPEVFQAMKAYFRQIYGNPSSLHQWGMKSKKAVEGARQKAAEILNCLPKEIIFTSCATESNNLAIKGVLSAIQPRAQGSGLRAEKLHLITSAIEHHSVLHPCKYLEKAGLVEVTYLPVSKEGIVDLSNLKKAIKKNTFLVSIMYANNEIGTIQPIAEIGELVKEVREKRLKTKNNLPIYFHTDAVQAFQYLDCDVKKLGVDLLSLTGHKFYAPKGIGVLYANKEIPLTPQLHGGGQEFGKRSGTQNVPYIVAIVKAMEKAVKNREKEKKRLQKLRDKLIQGISKTIPGAVLSGSLKSRLPNNVNFCFKGVEGESIVLKLSQAGIASSTGSACSSASLEPSHVLLALGIDSELTQGSLRLTLGKDTKEKDIDYVLRVLPKIVANLRKMSPLWK